MPSDELRAERHPAVRQWAVPKAAKESTVPVGCRQGGDGAETGASVRAQLKGEIFRVGILGGCGWRGCLWREREFNHIAAQNLNIPLNVPLKMAFYDVKFAQ